MFHRIAIIAADPRPFRWFKSPSTTGSLGNDAETLAGQESEMEMTYGRRHYLTQLVLAQLAWGGRSDSEIREFARASARFILAMTLIFLGLAALTPV